MNARIISIIPVITIVLVHNHCEFILPSAHGFVQQQQRQRALHASRIWIQVPYNDHITKEKEIFRSNHSFVGRMNSRINSDDDENDGYRYSWRKNMGNFVSSVSFLLAISFGGFSTTAFAAGDNTVSAGFEEFAAKGGVMKTDPSCFFDQCGDQSKSCFTNPSCLKGITCLGNCRGEQLCATQCFARFGSDKLNSWLSCTLEEKECVTTGVKQDTSSYYQNPPQTKSMEEFKPTDLNGKWYKVLGYNPKYDTYPCQINTFTSRSDGGLDNDILFRVPKPDSEGGSWQNNFVEKVDNSNGSEGKASMTVEGKMFGLTFHEQWYVIGQGTSPDWRAVAYIGDTQQGPYDGAFVYTKDKDALIGPDGANIRDGVNAALKEAGLDPQKMISIDNSCPADVTKAGVSKEDASKEKLEWKDLLDLTEWFRPGTLKKQTNFDPNKM